MPAGRVAQVGPMVPDERVLWLNPGDVLLLEEGGNSGMPGKASLGVIWAELSRAWGMAETVMVAIRWDLSTALLFPTDRLGHSRHPSRKRSE